jgi:putative flippase GtrA
VIELKEQDTVNKAGKRKISSSGLTTFIKTQAALIAGSLADFFVTYLLVEVFNCWYVTGNAAGNAMGAIAQFLLSRNWVFNKSYSEKTASQVLRFVVMWAGNIALSALGVYLLTHYIHLYYLLSKLIISVLMGVSYTYLLSKKFVFR